jgi:hypothetical protein
MLQLRKLEIKLRCVATQSISPLPAWEPVMEAITMRYMETVMGSVLTLASLALVVGTGVTLA